MEGDKTSCLDFRTDIKRKGCPKSQLRQKKTPTKL